MEEFVREARQRFLEELTREERQAVLDQSPPEERLRGLGPEELRQLQEYLKTLHSAVAMEVDGRRIGSVPICGAARSPRRRPGWPPSRALALPQGIAYLPVPDMLKHIHTIAALSFRLPGACW